MTFGAKWEETPSIKLKWYRIGQPISVVREINQRFPRGHPCFYTQSKLKKKSRHDQGWGPSGDFNLVNEVNTTERSDMSEHKRTAGDLSHITFNWNKKGNHLNACYDFKGLVPVGDPCLVAGEDILEVPQDGVPCTYHPMLSQKIKKGFRLSEVSTLTPADASGFTVRSTNTGTHKIDGFTFKNKDGWWERLDSSRSAFLQEWRLMAPPLNRLVWSRR